MDRGDALVRGDMRQQQAADQVAARIEMRLGGAHPRVDLATKPFSTLARVDSSPTLSEFGARPVATSICSARSSLGSSPSADHQPDARLRPR